jgi:N-acyl amino acid synthase of PEP-CTERM/exosortase system
MFDEHYEVILADSDEARRIHYGLRYQVYCSEEGFESPASFPDQMEKDHWDQTAVHFLVRSKQSDEWVAAMRLVRPREDKLPLHDVCSIDPLLQQFNSSEHVAEVSRICVKDAFRRNLRNVAVSDKRVSNKRNDAGGLSPVARQRYRRSEIMLGLLRAAAIYSWEHNIGSWYFLTTPALARLINQMNVQLIKIGPACQHRGKRFPFMADIKDSEERLRQGCKIVERMFSRVDNAYHSFTGLQHRCDYVAA